MKYLPDCLESDHTTTDPIWADLHDVYLACNPARSTTHGDVYGAVHTGELLYLHHCRVLRGPVYKLAQTRIVMLRSSQRGY